ncbi:MAG: hypothetical protein E4G99_12765 [Anaerolineales bacterium]|nr:MAG: hypothetical protein E4G99_12765 [Anaerolineales bacterium]
MKTSVPSSYMLTRATIALGLGLLIGWKTFWWSGLLVGAAALAFFLWAPVSGRYVVDRERGAKALARDERTQAIVGTASRNAFVTTLLSAAALTLYFGVINPGEVPVNALSFVVALGLLTYFASDLWLRRM